MTLGRFVRIFNAYSAKLHFAAPVYKRCIGFVYISLVTAQKKDSVSTLSFL
ncbi:hypothetical protein SAMN06269250_4846 [Spirosoma fluviale]|uniref:Uncharacterized protein n=1 Tax=Spirosoma fluviale TaxID=1597977 RepID=A0A286GIP9_9BACT|nr:hypothetical protein SAMN06269250_4846 [Spirosoma fluviale]